MSRTERWNVFLYEGILGVMVDRVAMEAHGIVMEYWPVLSEVESENISEEKWVLKIKNNKLRDLRVTLRSLKLCFTEYEDFKGFKTVGKNGLFLLLWTLSKQQRSV